MRLQVQQARAGADRQHDPGAGQQGPGRRPPLGGFACGDLDIRGRTRNLRGGRRRRVRNRRRGLLRRRRATPHAGADADARRIVVRRLVARLEHLQPLGHRLRALGWAKRHRRVHRAGEGAAVSGSLAGRQRLAEATVHALQRITRFLAGHALIERHAQRVDVRPRPLREGLHVLFDRRVGRRVEGDLGAGGLAGFETGGPEVDQHWATSVVIDQDVGGLDVTVDDAGLVHPIQPLGDRAQQPEQPCLVEGLPVAQHLRQRDALLEVHDHVGGAVDLEETLDGDDVRVPVGLRQVPQDLRLFDELP